LRPYSKVVPVFAGGLDFSVPVERYFFDPITKGAYVDTVLSLTGFALVGGPARQDHPKVRALQVKPCVESALCLFQRLTLKYNIRVSHVLLSISTCAPTSRRSTR